MRKVALGFAMGLLLLPLGLFAQSNEELMKQIEALKQQLQALESKVSAQQQAAPAPQEEMQKLDERLTKVEVKTASDNISWGGDIRVRYDNQSWTINPYNQYMGVDPSTGMPIVVPVPKQNWSNPDQWSVRLRLKMAAQITQNLKFNGRLSMYKLYGGADVPIFNGQPNTVASSFNSVRIPTGDVLHVERALLRYDFPTAPFTIAFGRMNSSDGPPLEVKEETERQGTPMALMVNAEVDGVHGDWHMDSIGLPEGTTFGICAGIGYESGFGGGGQVKESYTMTPFGMGRINGMKDSTVIGFIYDMPLLFEAGSTINSARFMLGYNRFGRMTDIPYGSLINFPIPGPYAQPSPQYVTATNNLGDMDQWGILWEHTINDKLTYFLSGGYIKSHPNGMVSQYGFGGLLGNPNGSETGTAYYAGLQYKPVERVSLGLEFNHGSPNWFTYSPDAGEPSAKLAARGDVWEGYVHYFFNKNFLMKLGYTYYDYSTAFSGWHIAPGPLSYYNLDNATAVNFYAFPKTVKDVYFAIEARW